MLLVDPGLSGVVYGLGSKTPRLHDQASPFVKIKDLTPFSRAENVAIGDVRAERIEGGRYPFLT